MSNFENTEDDEDMEGNVYIDENEAVLEEDIFLDKDLKIKKKEEEDDFYAEDSDEDETQKTLLETKISEEDKKENKQNPKLVVPIITQNSNKSKKEVKKEAMEVKMEDKKVKEKAITPKKPKVNKKPIKKETKTKVSKKKDKKKKNYVWPIIISLAIIAIIVFAIIYFQPMESNNNQIVAKINGHEVTREELDTEYEFFFFMGGIPEEYKNEITKEIFLSSSMVSEEIILQEAAKKNIVVSDEEVIAFLEASVIVPDTNLEQFEEAANNRGLSMEDIHKYLKRQIISFKLLNETVLGEIEVTDDEIFAAYTENLVLFEEQGQSFADVKDYIKQTILTERQRSEAQLYMDNLKEDAEIEIYYVEEIVTENPTEEDVLVEIVEENLIKTFEETGDGMCYDENGKPLVILFSTTYCPHCVWVKDTFESVVADYDVAAYHWELDKGDNTLTAEMESTLPKQHIDILKEYNPNGYVPAFVIGCKYVRIGNGYEAEDSLVMEENELRTAIESLI